MIIYFAGAERHFDVLYKENVQNMLCSAYLMMNSNSNQKRVFMNSRPPIKRLFVDSGAYSAMTLGVDISISKYIEFIKKHIDKIHIYAGLDSIGDYDKTIENQKIMENSGLNPLWTFHFNENKIPYNLLDEQLEKYGYIALGGTVGVPAVKVEEYLNKCFSIIGKHWPIKVHSFGMTNFNLLKKFPFYSVDSTSWLFGQLRGHIYFFNNGKMDYCRFTEVEKIIEHGQRNLVDDKSSLEINYKNRNLWNIQQWKNTETYITELWRKKGIVWD